MDALTLDQFQVLTTVVDEGSFSAAARKLNRAQSAITYAIQKMEEQIGAELFDRSAYRPVLSEAGRALLPRARKVIEDVAAFRIQARGIAEGLEPELSIVVESMAPMCELVGVLKDFQAAFPSVHTRILVETLGATVAAVLDGRAEVGVVADLPGLADQLIRRPSVCIELVAVCAPDHRLADYDGVIPREALREEVQLVLTDRSDLTKGRDYGVASVNTWRLGDLGAKHAMLLAGLGWGSMPAHMVEADLAAGRLVRLKPGVWDDADQLPTITFMAAHRADRALGPAGRWLFDRLSRT